MSNEEETSYTYEEPTPAPSPTGRLLATLGLLGMGMDAVSGGGQRGGAIRAQIPTGARQRTRGKGGKSKRGRRG